MWWIGDGSQVKIRGDKWIPTTHSHMIQSPIQGIHQDARVCDIINFETNWWNIPLIEQVFPAELVDHICNISISPRVMHDRLILAGTTAGQFIEHSAYHLEVDRQACSRGSCSALSSNTPIWKLLWQLQIPRNVQLFIQRACNKIFPTKENLRRRRIVDDPLCPMCGKEVESTTHAIWNSAAAQAVWTECPT